MTPEGLEILSRLAQDTTLRYVLNLISCAQMLAQKRKAEAVDSEDVKRAYEYFHDEKRSVEWISDQTNYLVSEEGVDFAVGGQPFGKAKTDGSSEVPMDES